ncbi:MAG: acetylxylan esterase [Candidatus Sumerlaeia bacterium]
MQNLSDEEIRGYYPTEEEVDVWLEEIWMEACAMPCEVEIMHGPDNHHQYGIRHVQGQNYVRFQPDGEKPFYGYWQPAHSPGAPLLVHLPGYGAEMSIHPDLVAAGFNVLHVNPLGYATPKGADESLKRGAEAWPVLPDTIHSGAMDGYFRWLRHAAQAVNWALEQPACLDDRVSFFGTSQGGGGSLLMASLYRDHGVRCVAADQPFLTNFPKARKCDSAYNIAWNAIRQLTIDAQEGWKAVGYIDTLQHARRLTCPVLLTSGAQDTVCPPDTIEALFEHLPATRSYTQIAQTPHGYNPHFIQLAKAWFRLYA